MNYLLVNHVPFFKGQSPGVFRLGDLWLEDLRAQARAIHAAGGRLTVATPLERTLAETASGSFNLIEIRPPADGFNYAPLTRYQSMKQYLLRRATVRRELTDAIGKTDVVQMGYGGHPVGLGRVAFPIAKKLGKHTIWVFDGADPFPRLQLLADNTRNPVKRWIKRRMNRKFEAFCRRAIRESDLVFAHNNAVVERFKDVWGPHCYQFDRSFVTDEIVLNETEIAARAARLLDKNRSMRLVVCGRQILIKGTDHVLRALAKARRLGGRLSLDVIGDGTDLPGFIELSRELGLEDHVRVRGVVPYGKVLFDVWAECDLMVITNLTAEISRNTLLAAARGMPIITYQNAGTDKMLNDAEAGWIVERGNVDALAETFVQACRERQKLVTLLHNARTLAKSITLDNTHRRRAELAAALFKK